MTDSSSPFISQNCIIRHRVSHKLITLHTRNRQTPQAAPHMPIPHAPIFPIRHPIEPSALLRHTKVTPLILLFSFLYEIKRAQQTVQLNSLTNLGPGFLSGPPVIGYRLLGFLAIWRLRRWKMGFYKNWLSIFLHCCLGGVREIGQMGPLKGD